MTAAPVPQQVPAHPGASSPEVARRMASLRRRDTRPELELRRRLHARGLRYRVAYPIPGQRRRTIDVAFTRARVAVFVDGCFWHGCPEHGNRSGSNTGWWERKLEANRARDLDSTRVLEQLGWRVLRFWEHADADGAAEQVAAAVGRPGRPARPGRPGRPGSPGSPGGAG